MAFVVLRAGTGRNEAESGWTEGTYNTILKSNVNEGSRIVLFFRSTIIFQFLLILS